jgi:RNA polymerase sigma-70 factor, ECF subfamily
MTNEPSPAPRIEEFREYLMVLARSRIGQHRPLNLEVSDVVQETLLEAHKKRDQFRGTEPASMAAWLRQMLAYNITDRLRALGRQKRDISREVAFSPDSLDESSARMEQWVAAEQTSPSLKLMHMEQVLAVASAIEALPESQGEAIRMRYVEGLSLAEIAERLGKSETAIAGLLKRGLESLRGQLRLA